MRKHIIPLPMANNIDGDTRFAREIYIKKLEVAMLHVIPRVLLLLYMEDDLQRNIFKSLKSYILQWKLPLFHCPKALLSWKTDAPFIRLERHDAASLSTNTSTRGTGQVRSEVRVQVKMFVPVLVNSWEPCDERTSYHTYEEWQLLRRQPQSRQPQSWQHQSVSEAEESTPRRRQLVLQ